MARTPRRGGDDKYLFMRIESNGWTVDRVDNDGHSAFILKRGRGAMPDKIKNFLASAPGSLRHTGGDVPAFHKSPKGKYAKKAMPKL